MVNSNCYNFEQYKYKKGIFDSFIDATYILTLVGSDRIENINKQLEYVIPTKNVFIVLNKGYKKCDKVLYKQNSVYDIVDANKNALEHSLKNNFNNILILEDDFIFSEKLKDKNIINDIKLFINNNKNKVFYYNLGTYPILFYPNINLFNNIYRGIYCPLAHANIYNKNCVNEIFKNIKNIKLSWDEYLVENYINYFYKYPLIYQIFPETENKKLWFSKKLKNSFFKYIDDLRIKILNLDKEPQPGFNIMYTFFFILNYSIWVLIIIIFIYIIYFILYYFVNNKIEENNITPLREIDENNKKL
jgi:sulfur transfer complex TusBCD TusB component (DsrH family)